MDEIVLNAWEHWKIVKVEDQTENDLRSKAFEEIKNCKEKLFLRHMSLSFVPNVFPCGLKELRISGNKLITIPNNLPATLEILDIESNKLTSLPNNLPKSLRYLFANDNEIKFLPETLPKKLIEMHIQSNELVSLPERLPKSLKILYLSDNRIINPKFDNESILELFLEDNGIEIIHEEYFNLPKLQALFVANNKLIMLPRNLPETLESLYASNNKFTEILTDLPKSLRYLDLDGNNIARLQVKLPPQLELLSLHDNRLTEIPTELSESLVTLCLSKNLITDVSSNLESIPNAYTINLEENPLTETSLEYLRQLLHTRDHKNIWFDDTRPLIEEISNWLDTELIHPYWNKISKEAISRQFSLLLNRIRKTSNFTVAQFKEDMSKWLCSLGEDNDCQQKLREKIFLIVAEANESCEHRVGWFLNQIKILSIVQEIEWGKYDSNIEELIRLARGMYRLDILDQISRGRNLENSCDDIEIYLEYQIRLRDVLDLPICTLKMNDDFDFVLSDEDIERGMKEIIDKERIEFIDYLVVDWHPWKEVLKRWNCEQFIKCENHIRNEENFKQTLDKRKEQYFLETNMSDFDEPLPLDIEIQLGSQVQRQIEKSVWIKLTIEFLESKHLGTIIERLGFNLSVVL